MKRFHFSLAAIGVAAACYGGGYAMALLGGSVSSRPDTNGGGATHPAGSKSSLDLRVKKPRDSRSELDKSNKTIAALSGIANSGNAGMLDRYRSYLRMVSAADASELGDLIRKIRTEMPDDLGGESLQELIIKRWTDEDSMGALAALIGGRSRLLEGDSGTIIFAALAKDRDTAWEKIQSISSLSRREDLMGDALVEIASTAPEDALKKANDLGGTGSHPNVWKQLLSNLADNEKAIELALSAARELPRSVIPEDFYRSAFETLTERNPQMAIEALADLHNVSERREAVTGLAQSWGEDDMTAAIEWANGLESATERGVALRAALEVSADSHPVEVAELFSQLSLRDREALSGDVARHWFKEDRAAAMDWVNNEVEGPSRQNALHEILSRHHGSIDFEEQLDMANQLTGHRDARASFVERWVGNDPEAAVGWAAAQAIEDAPALHLSAVREWFRHDQEAVVHYVGRIENPKMKEDAIRLIAARVAEEPTLSTLINESGVQELRDAIGSQRQPTFNEPETSGE